uniref:uncharacterized protein LOC122608850 n=1 Tax=Erigeron canadensis TaxID=72917 RepID=UPI001CB968DE|nr:uncharacterized protein LOC122608850 [Erigeron canadensis]
MDIFAWEYKDMIGVPRVLTLEGKPFVTEHRLNGRKHIESVHQKNHSLSTDRDEAARKEVEELLRARIIRESTYPVWIANLVMVKKGDRGGGGWRMCVDFTNINRACPKDCYPLPEIDWKVESLTEHKLKCFLDAYKGYHQIQMAKEDEDKTAFYTRATYQRLVDKAFATQIGRNLEAYVDDMVIKSRDEEGLIEDILETFGNLHLSAEDDQRSPKLKRQTPRTQPFPFSGRRQGAPFLQNIERLYQQQGLAWTDEANKALEQMKEYITNLPTLTTPKPKENLFVYLAASPECVNAVLVAERDRHQIPIYFVSRVLQGVEANYSELEKLTLALVHAIRRLRRYFQAHPIVVLSDKPIKQILLKPEKSGRVVKWAIELGERDIEFRARHAIKGQVLADFISEVHEGKKSMTHSVSLEVVGSVEHDTWKLYTDGAASSDGCGAGLMLISPKDKESTYALRFEFEVTNNEAEYEALLAGLRMARDMKIHNIHAYVDSQLVACQVKGESDAKQGTTKLYLQKVRELIECFSHFEIEDIRRNQNKKADALGKLALLTFGHLGKKVLVEVLKERSIEEKQVSDLVDEEGEIWMTPIYEFLISGILSTDKDEARKIRVKAPQYKILDKKLYKKGFVTPWLRCAGPKQAEMIIREIHEGICRAHSGARSVATKAMRLGYFWPTMHQDLTALLKNCEARQLRANVSRQPKNDMTLHTANRTTPKRSNGETPFRLAFGTEAVAPAEFLVSTYRMLNTEGNNEELRIDLDLLEERREIVAIREAAFKKKIEGYYNKRVNPTSFKTVDYVFRLNSASEKEHTGKLGPTWEGPYRV